MKIDLKFNKTELEKLLHETISNKYGLCAIAFDFKYDLIEERSGITGFTGVTVTCEKFVDKKVSL